MKMVSCHASKLHSYSLPALRLPLQILSRVPNHQSPVPSPWSYRYSSGGKGVIDQFWDWGLLSAELKPQRKDHI
jgi:hypothetical protein